jgi:hypothetical protein
MPSQNPRDLARVNVVETRCCAASAMLGAGEVRQQLWLGTKESYGIKCEIVVKRYKEPLDLWLEARMAASLICVNDPAGARKNKTEPDEIVQPYGR